MRQTFSGVTVEAKPEVQVSLWAYLQPQTAAISFASFRANKNTQAATSPLPTLPPDVQSVVRAYMSGNYSDASVGIDFKKATRIQNAGATGTSGLASAGTCDEVTQVVNAGDAGGVTAMATPTQPGCACKPGWTGLGCAACSKFNNGCPALLQQLGQSTDAMCNTNMTYTSSTAYKDITCNVPSSATSLLETMNMYCSTVSASAVQPLFKLYRDILTAVQDVHGAPRTGGTASTITGSTGSETPGQLSLGGGNALGTLDLNAVVSLVYGTNANFTR